MSVNSVLAEVSRQCEVVVRDELGLHARPAARVARAAQDFLCRITLTHNGLTADAKSILDILSLAAGCGSLLLLECQGEDAEAATQALEALFQWPLAVGEKSSSA